MADRDLWRKNLPDDFEGRHGEHWDDEIHVKPILWSTVAIAVSVLVAFVLCWYLIVGLSFTVDTPPPSPVAEANARQLPPSPWLQPKPEVEYDDLRESLDSHLSSYGWVVDLDERQRVHLPVERALQLTVEAQGGVPATIEPAVDRPVDVQAPSADEDTDEAGGAPGEPAPETPEPTPEGENSSR